MGFEGILMRRKGFFRKGFMFFRERGFVGSRVDFFVLFEFCFIVYWFVIFIFLCLF